MPDQEIQATQIKITPTTVDPLSTNVTYNPRTWVDGAEPTLSAENLNVFEGILADLMRAAEGSKSKGVVLQLIDALNSEINARKKDITDLSKHVYNNVNKLNSDLTDAKETHTTDISNLNTRISKFGLAEVTLNDGDQNSKTKVISSIKIDPTPQGATSYVIVETADINLNEIDIPDLNSNKIYINESTTSLTTELSTRAAKDNELQNSITNLTSVLNTESSTRKDADDALRKSITDLSSALRDESSTRENADKQLSDTIKIIEDNLGKEIENRKSADATLQSGINTLNDSLANETTARSNADNEIRNQISNLTSDNIKVDSSTLTEKLNSLQSGVDAVIWNTF